MRARASGAVPLVTRGRAIHNVPVEQGVGVGYSPDGQWWWSGTEWRPTRPPGQRRRLGKLRTARWWWPRKVALLGLVGAGVATLTVGTVGVLAARGLPTPVKTFHGDAALPLRIAASVSLALLLVGLLCWSGARRHPRVLVVSAVTMVAAVVVLAVGGVDEARLEHPQGQMRAALEALHLPSGFSRGGISISSNDTTTREYYPQAQGYWGTSLTPTTACDQAAAALRPVSQLGSVDERTNTGLTDLGQPPCQIEADYRGFSLEASLYPSINGIGYELVVELDPTP